MPDFDDIRSQNHFMIFDNYPSFNPNLYSVWDVNRSDKFIAVNTNQATDSLYCFVRTLSGKGRILTTLGIFDVGEDTLLLIRENIIEEYYSVNGIWTYNWYNFRTDVPVPFFELNKIYSIEHTFMENQTKNEMFTVMQHYNEFNIKLTSSLFLSIIYRWITICRDETENADHHVADIKHIISYINNNIGKDMAINDLAAKCFLSERQFRSIFGSYMGLPPKKYICQQKLKKAAFLLRTTSQTITQIAAELNYSSPFQLSRDFKIQYGLAPKEYRKQ